MFNGKTMSRWWPGLALIVVVTGLAGCGGGGGSGGGNPDLFLVAFHEDQRTNVYRDQVLTFEFTTVVDPNTVDLDTFQIFTGTTQNPDPFIGLFQVSGNFVLFLPVVDENTPNRGAVPLNPYGFDENTTYQVKIPSTADTPSPLKVLASDRNKKIIQSFTGSFATGAGYTPTPNEANPIFEPYDVAVYDTVNPPYSPSNPKGTAESDDDVLTYTPVPNESNPPLNPVTNQPDFRAQHPTNVQAQVTFTSVMDPRSFRSDSKGNLRLEFNSPGSNAWNFIPTSLSVSPNGRTLILTAATPLANQNRNNKYRLVVDQTTYPILSRGGKKLIEVVEKWDNNQRQVVRTTIGEPHLTFWCAQVPGETGPLLTAVFPLEAFAKDSGRSDTDVAFASGTITAGPVMARTSADNTQCNIPGNPAACNRALREPLTQDPASQNQNQNTKGPSKVMFHFNEYQHGVGAQPYKLMNAEALTGMSWGPLCSTVLTSTYPKLHIHVMWSNRNSTNAQAPGFLPSSTYNSNFDVNPPGFAVRDGSSPYQLTTSTQSTWESWQFQQPFTDYQLNRGLVWVAWTEVGGDWEHYFKWYSPNANPNTRMFSPPTTSVNPAVGSFGQWTYYWAQFDFKRLRSLAVTKYYRMTKNNADKPLWNTVVVAPSRANLPGGTDYRIEYSGARFNNYTPKQGGFFEGQGSPSATSTFSSNISNMNGLPAVGLRVVFSNNLNQIGVQSLPFLNSVSFTFEL